MVGNWFSKTLGKSPPVQDYTGTQKEMVLLLVIGRNTFGDEIYSYLRLPMRRMTELKTALDSGQPFTPANYGVVVAAGRGKPPADVIEEVGVPDYLIQFNDPKDAMGRPKRPGGYQ